MDDPNLVRKSDPKYSEKPEPFVIRGGDDSSEVFRKIREIGNFFPSGCLELVGSDLMESFGSGWHEYFLAQVKQMIFQVFYHFFRKF